MASSKHRASAKMEGLAKENVAGPARHPRNRPLIVLDNVGMPGGDVSSRLVALARELDWVLLDPAYRCEALPPNVIPQGAIVFRTEGDALDELTRRGCPVVRIGDLPHANDVRVPAVVPDLAATGRLAAEHFEERGFKHVLFVGYDVGSAGAGGFLYEAFNTRATALGLACHAMLFKSGRAFPTESNGERYRRRTTLFADRIRELPAPVGVFTIHDGVARTLCCMCEDAGNPVPEQVAILGVGNDRWICECMKTTLSAIAHDRVAEVDVAVRLLQTLMAGEAVLETTVMIPPVGIVARESTNTVGTLDPKVNEAVRYMWEHLAVNLSVDDVARAVGLARSTLDRRFRSKLGRSVSAELRRKRLHELCRLLRTTDAPVVDLATRVGFPSREHLHRVFHRAYGVSPGQYRHEATQEHGDQA